MLRRIRHGQQLVQQFNELTGYAPVERLKRAVSTHEAQFDDAQVCLREAKATFRAAIAERASTAREMNELLERKHGWTPTDLERFTHLYRQSHASEKLEKEAGEELERKEADMEDAQRGVLNALRTRYHEEQVWSDKIRLISSYGAWALMALNIMLFMLVQLAVEPRKQRRLVEKFERLLHAVHEEQKAELHRLAEVVESRVERKTVELRVAQRVESDRQGRAQWTWTGVVDRLVCYLPHPLRYMTMAAPSTIHPSTNDRPTTGESPRLLAAFCEAAIADEAPVGGLNRPLGRMPEGMADKTPARLLAASALVRAATLLEY